MVNKADFTPPLQPNLDLSPEQPNKPSNLVDNKTNEVAKGVIGSSTGTLEIPQTSDPPNLNHVVIKPESTLINKTYELGIDTLKIDQSTVLQEQVTETSNSDFSDFEETSIDEDSFANDEWAEDDLANEENEILEDLSAATIQKNSSLTDEFESATGELEDKVEEEAKADEAVSSAVRKEDTTNEALASLNDVIAETTKIHEQLSAEIDDIVIDPRFANFDKEQIKDELKATQAKFQELASLLEEFMVKGETITTKDGKEIVVFKKATAEEVAKNPENCALLKDGKLVCHSPGSRDMRALTEDQAAELRKKYGSLDKVPESEFPTASAMNSEESAELHSIIKEYRALSDKMSLLESLLLNHVENEKPHESKSHETHAKASESAPRTETVHVEEKPVADDKDDAKAKKTDRFIMPDFSTSTQRKKERIRQDKQDEEDKQITRDAIKRKNESYRQDQERIQDDFIKKSDLSLKRKSADRQKKTP